MKRFEVTIAGEINMDLVLYGVPEDVPIEREILAENFCATLGSSSAIVAHNVSSLGSRVGFITRVGRDQLGETALERLRESGTDVSRVVRAMPPQTTGVTVLLQHGRTRRIFTYPGAMSEMTASDLDLDYLADSRHFHISSLFLQRSLAPDLPRIVRKLKKAGLTVSLDTNDDPEDRWGGVLHELLPLVDMVLPNEEEACRMTRSNTVEEAAAALAHKVPCVAIKCGARGALVRCGDRLVNVPGVPVTPVDTIGAGDSFDAGFITAFLRGADWEECAHAGNVTGALSTLRPGGTEAFRDAGLRQDFLQVHAAGTYLL